MGRWIHTLFGQDEEWEKIRAHGRTRYVLKYFFIPYGVVLPLAVSFGTFPLTSSLGVTLWDMCQFLMIFGPAFAILAVVMGNSSWKHWEKKWLEAKKTEKEVVSDRYPSTRPFSQYRWLIASLWDLPFLALIFISFFTIGTLFSLFFFFLNISLLFASLIFLLATMILIKNPICGHGLMVDLHERSPKVKSNPIKLAWKAARGLPFRCPGCGRTYMLRRRGKVVDIVEIKPSHQGQNGLSSEQV